MAPPTNTFEIVVIVLLVVVLALWLWAYLRQPAAGSLAACAARQLQPAGSAANHAAANLAARVSAPFHKHTSYDGQTRLPAPNMHLDRHRKGLRGGETDGYRFDDEHLGDTGTALAEGFQQFKQAPSNVPSTQWNADPASPNVGGPLGGRTRSQVMSQYAQSLANGGVRAKFSVSRQKNKGHMAKHTGERVGAYALYHNLTDEMQDLDKLAINCERLMSGGRFRIPSYHPCHDLSVEGRAIAAQVDNTLHSSGRANLRVAAINSRK